MKSLKIIVLAALLAATALPAAAQNRPGRNTDQPSQEEMVQRRLDMLDRQLNLTDEQQAQIRTILEESARERESLFNESGGDRDRRRETMQRHMQAVNERIKALLDADQQKKYDEVLQNGRDRMRGRRGTQGGMALRRMPPRLGAGLSRVLDLTNSQQDRVAEIRKEARDAMQQWRTSHPEARRADRTAFLREQVLETRAAIDAVLTPEQRAAREAYFAGLRDGTHRGMRTDFRGRCG